MSEVQKPVVEEQAVAPVEVAPVVEEVAPAVETAVVEPEAPAEVAAVEEATEAKAETATKEFAGEGVLGYKAPGGFIKKLAGFQKKFFWFGADAVEAKALSNYLRGEKPEIGNHNAAWSSQTGKGLLYFSKHATDKTAPVGIINLADITDITEDGTVDFFFHSHSQKHVFQATSLVDRDSWVAALKTASAEAKESSEAITGSEGYKEQLASLSKPAPVVAAPSSPKKEEKTEAKEEEKKEEKAEAKEEKKEEKKSRTKSRSASRKRTSIFGNFGLGKKEETAEKAEEPKEEAAESSAAPVEAAVEEVAPAAAVEEAAPVEATPAETRPAASKRNSIFGTLSSKFGKKSSEAAAPEVPAKDDKVVTSADAPVIPAVEESEPLATSIASPATVPTETVTDGAPETEAAEAKPETKPEVKSEKRKSSLPFGLGSAKKEKTPEVEGEKPLSPFAKLRQTVKAKTHPRAAEKTEKAEEKTEEAAVESVAAAATEATETAEEPVAPAAIHAATPQVSATA